MHLQILIMQKNSTTYQIPDKSVKSIPNRNNNKNTHLTRMRVKSILIFHFQSIFHYIAQHQNTSFKVTEINKVYNFSTEVH